LVQGGDVVDLRLHAERAEFEPPPFPLQVALVELRGDAEPPTRDASDSLPRVAGVDRAASQQSGHAGVVEPADPGDVVGLRLDPLLAPFDQPLAGEALRVEA